MLDTMTFTKVLGSLCGALLVFMLGGWAAETIYHPGHGAHGEQAYRVDTGAEEDTAEAPVVDEVSFEERFAAADPEAGSKLWRQCAACHALEAGKNGTGPSLHAVVGRDKGIIEGFRYSAAMTGAPGVWEPENIYSFIENPKGYLPGTSMAYPGMRKSEDRANLIAYIATFAD